MSHIFDALQRSEAERSRADSLEAAEMLQRAERRATRWESAVLSEQLDGMRSADRNALLERPSEQAVATISRSYALFETSQTEECRDPFGHFQSLQVLVSPQSRLVTLTESGGPAAEAFRLLGVRLRHLRRDRALKKVLITSTISQEGKSMVVGNLASTLALRTQQKILVLEGDLRRPSLAQMFGIGRNPGLCEWLEGEGSLESRIYHLKDRNLWILPAGSSPSNALELLHSGRLAKLMDQLSEWFDWIIIDSPPVLPLADTSVWMRFADGILLTTRQGTTEKRMLQKGLEAIDPKKLIGALVNSSKNAVTSYYYSPPTS